MDITKLQGHTPEPWEAQNGRDVIAHDGPAPRYLAQVHTWFKGHKEERAANAALIAAAPDLLKLAKLGLELAARVDKCSRDGGCEACAKLARALREKADKL